MRHLILRRLEQLRTQTGNFPKNTTRWENVKIKGIHVSNFNFESLPDDELITAFERILRLFYAQM